MAGGIEDKIMWATGAASLANVGLGGFHESMLMAAAGAAGLAFVGYRTTRRHRLLPVENRAAAPPEQPLARGARRADPNSDDVESLVDEMLAQQRFCLLLRRQIYENLTQSQRTAARQALEAGMALVPHGGVQFRHVEADLDDGPNEAPPEIVPVDGFYLDRYQVSNRQYLEFVAAGGYEQMAIWEPTIWAAVLDFTDQTGHPGPRYWRNGQYAAGEDNLPVVGVCWHEAVAYARWAGKRLPTTAEWVRAASWPVPLSPTKLLQRRFPWGDGMDRQRCNVWGSGPGRPVDVGQYATGANVCGVQQLIGNVWEWTCDDFGALVPPGEDVLLAAPMKSLHGGAFDTYFENQTSTQFQSADSPLARKHNIGFRCAISVCDLHLLDHDPADDFTSPEGAL